LSLRDFVAAEAIEALMARSSSALLRQPTTPSPRSGWLSLAVFALTLLA
jgi:hypothetical protein